MTPAFPGTTTRDRQKPEVKNGVKCGGKAIPISATMAGSWRLCVADGDSYPKSKMAVGTPLT
jgi:hypothetical protein